MTEATAREPSRSPESPPGRLRRLVVGTAGHVDHGKTTLIEALTGIDCDRWAEEKARGITIDLGFAHLQEGDLQVGFVDVPGHERFVHNALAGLGGIRLVLLVVAADEGVEPQTREHLAICGLLGIETALVALTKTDLVSAELVELAALEIEELLASTPFAGSPVIPVSAVTGEGLEALRRTLLDRAATVPVPFDPARPARLPIDRAFHLKGLGVLVTGTLVSGRISVGDELELTPGGGRARVRGIQVHGASRPEAFAGERTSLQLGGLPLERLGRGQQLTTPGALAPAHSLLARCTWLPEAGKALAGWRPVRLHCYAAEVLGKARAVDPPELAPGQRGIVEIRLDAPLSAARGDRFVLRRPSPVATLGGGEILDPRWHRRRGAPRDAAIAALGLGDEEALLVWVQEAGEGGAETARLARRLGTTPGALEPDLEALAARQRVLRVPPGPGRSARWLAPAVVERVAQRARRVLQDYFRRERLTETLPKAEALRRILRGRGEELADLYLKWLAAQNVLQETGEGVALPGRKPELSGEESRLATRIAELYEGAGLTPPSTQELARQLGAKPAIFEGVVGYLVRQGRLVRLPTGLLLSRAAVEGMLEELRATGWERFTVPQFKERFNLSRKWAIPLLEHLDSRGATRRLGDERQLVG